IVGEKGLILVGSEKGPWHKVDSGTKQRLLSVSLNDKGVAFAIGAFGVLLKSTDYGQTWHSAAPDWKPLYNNTGPLKSIVPITRPTNYVVEVFDDGSVVIGGEYGQILRSPDLGKNWNLAYRFPKTSKQQVSPTVFGMHIEKNGTGYAVGQAGLILKTVDYGKSWTKLNVPAAKGQLLFAVDTYPDGHINIAGMRMVLCSRDGGQSWKRLHYLDFDLSWYNDLSHPSSAAPGSSFLVGNRARIVRLAPGH
ncbi:MAG: YCF48-related protein, partial [Sinobacteraceae bacterium]|nr:YCF48-related protein [Nevskiaceae bacterium]